MRTKIHEQHEISKLGVMWLLEKIEKKLHTSSLINDRISNEFNVNKSTVMVTVIMILWVVLLYLNSQLKSLITKIKQSRVMLIAAQTGAVHKSYLLLNPHIANVM